MSLQCLPKQVAQSFFVEPSTGRAFPVGSAPYTNVQCLWNHHNVWVAVPGSCTSITMGSPSAFDLEQSNKWMCLLNHPAYQVRSCGWSPCCGLHASSRCSMDSGWHLHQDINQKQVRCPVGADMLALVLHCSMRDSVAAHVQHTMEAAPTEGGWRKTKTGALGGSKGLSGQTQSSFSSRAQSLGVTSHSLGHTMSERPQEAP